VTLAAFVVVVRHHHDEADRLKSSLYLAKTQAGKQTWSSEFCEPQAMNREERKRRGRQRHRG
jgi:hypothetical protein